MSNTVKYFALACAISATAAAGVTEGYLSRFTYLFNLDRSTHMRIFSEFFFGVTTIGAHHSVGSVTGAMIPCWTRRSISYFNLSL